MCHIVLVKQILSNCNSLLLDHRYIQNTIRTYSSNCTNSNILITVLIPMSENEASYNFNNENANHGSFSDWHVCSCY